VKNKRLRVYFLAAEADPFIKVGGLGDVAMSLPQALHKRGDIDVRLVIPFHGAIQRRSYPLQPVASFDVPHIDGPIAAEALATELDGLPVYLIAGSAIPPDAPVYSSDAGVDGHKFTFFSLAALQLLREIDWRPDVIHANDWHTAPAIYALAQVRAYDSFFSQVGTVLGIHNLPYLGIGAGKALRKFGLPPANDSPLPQWAQDLPLPLGLLTADRIVAVSPRYAEEILTPEFGSGLEEFLQSRADVITGILNGIDVEKWDPSTDDKLPHRYSLDNLSARTANKATLLDSFGLNFDPQVPLLTMITRMDPQKGVDLVPDALRQIDELPWQAIILGRGVPELEDSIRKLEIDYANRVRAAIRYDAVLSQQLYGGADAILIPSRYEPCGLSQMIAMRYGCVPVARATGGLSNTIRDFNQTKKSNGFLFRRANATDLAMTLRRALQVYGIPEKWRGLQRQGMKEDFSWDQSARQYAQLYKVLTQERQDRNRK